MIEHHISDRVANLVRQVVVCHSPVGPQDTPSMK
jgi:hypothetical protein